MPGGWAPEEEDVPSSKRRTPIPRSAHPLDDIVASRRTHCSGMIFANQDFSFLFLNICSTPAGGGGVRLAPWEPLSRCKPGRETLAWILGVVERAVSTIWDLVKWTQYEVLVLFVVYRSKQARNLLCRTCNSCCARGLGNVRCRTYFSLREGYLCTILKKYQKGRSLYAVLLDQDTRLISMGFGNGLTTYTRWALRKIIKRIIRWWQAQHLPQ
jgi:hypothetical protein